MKISFGENYVEGAGVKKTIQKAWVKSLECSGETLTVDKISAGDIIDFKLTEPETDRALLASGRYFIESVKNAEIYLKNLAFQKLQTEVVPMAAITTGKCSLAGQLDIRI